MTTISESITMRQWIEGAAGRNSCVTDVASSPWIAASLKIALSLTEQISRAEKLAALGVYGELELLPNGAVSDWAEFVRIRLKSSENHGPQHTRNDGSKYKSPAKNDGCQQQGTWEEFESQLLSYEPCASGSIEATGWQDENEQAIDEHMKSFLEALEADEFEPPAAAAHCHQDDLASSPSDYEYHAELNLSHAISSQTESQTESVNLLDVDLAFIRCPETEPSNFFERDAGTSADKLRRIYFLGLVFYELFSGGEVPPPGLYALAFSDRAFMSLPILTLAEKDDDARVSKSECKRRRGPSGSTEGVGLCQLSLEYLKLIGLPGPLCNLIFNMLDCVYGDLSGNDCYGKMIDVTFDLQLMINKPEKFLRDLDMEKLTLSGFEMNETVFLREEELASIKSCFDRSVMESSELAIITGDSGTGKSWLARHVGRFFTAQGGLFLSGKFDQMKHVTPFSALASAFDEYCDVLIREKESDWVKLIVEKLNDALGRESHHLIKVIPKLSHILSCNTSFGDALSGQNCVNAIQRLHYLMCQFVDIISTFSVASVTLFLDDLQWADAASISVLNRLLLKRQKKFFFLGCCRGAEMENEHPFWDMIENLLSFGIKTTVVELKCMEKDTLNQLVSDLLCLPPRVVRSLSDIIHTKTKGNPLFFSQLMLSLSRDGLLRLSLGRQRWVWDEDEIQSMKLPDDVALCFVNGITQLPLDVQSALRILSMFGASAKCEYIEVLEAELHVKIVEPMKLAMAEGLVNNVRGSFRFCHDRIQEASYAMIEEQDRTRDHLTFGLILVKLSLDNSDNEMLFTAVNQINFGGPSAVSGAQEFATMAKYNLMAGKRAMEMSDFQSAFAFFSFGIDFLPHGHWQVHYDLSLELYDLASKSALAACNIGGLQVLADEVLQNAQSFQDKLTVYFIMVSSLAYASKSLEALELGHKILSRLGEDIPINPSKEALDQQIQQTQSLIKGISEHDILNFRLMTDKRKLAAMKFLAQLENTTLMIKPSLHPFVTLRMVQLTITNGLSPVSPIGFVYFGCLLAKRGNIRLGHRFTVLARSLIEKLNAREIAGEVICVATGVLCFVEPVQTASNLLMTQGEFVAMTGGDIRSACLNRLHYCGIMFWTCPSLSLANKAFSEGCRFMSEQQHKSSLCFMLPIYKTILKLMGDETEALTNIELSQIIQESRNPRHLLLLSFILENDGMLKEYAEKFYAMEKSSWFLFFGDSAQTLIVGLVAFQVYRATNDYLWLDRGRKCTADMKLWAQHGSLWNFHHKLMLLEAEEHYSNGKVENAQLSYKNAIASAKSHKFINDEALACELAAKFYLATGNVRSSLEHFRLAHEKYHQWGALGKADRLFAYINETFSNVSSDNSASLSRIVNNSGVLNLQGPASPDSRKRRVL